jgi:tetratricopeptide (TPR) repeat protein
MYDPYILIKPGLLELVNTARAYKRDFIDQLSAAEREEVGTPEQWAARDVITHVTFWEERQALRVAAALAREESPAAVDEEETNQRLLAEHRGRPWAALEAEVERVYTALTAALQAGTEADLTDPQLRPWLNNRPLWLGITGNVVEHPVAHYADFYQERGDLARATHLRETAARTLARLFPGTQAHGIAVYNLGCFYALTSRPDQAIAALREALECAPDLALWSQQDSDLDSLRDLPAFQALYEYDSD